MQLNNEINMFTIDYGRNIQIKMAHIRGYGRQIWYIFCICVLIFVHNRYRVRTMSGTFQDSTMKIEPVARV